MWLATPVILALWKQKAGGSEVHAWLESEFEARLGSGDPVLKRKDKEVVRIEGTRALLEDCDLCWFWKCLGHLCALRNLWRRVPWRETHLDPLPLPSQELFLLILHCLALLPSTLVHTLLSGFPVPKGSLTSFCLLPGWLQGPAPGPCPAFVS